MDTKSGRKGYKIGDGYEDRQWQTQTNIQTKSKVI
jgi:hypothetical protein